MKYYFNFKSKFFLHFFLAIFSFCSYANLFAEIWDVDADGNWDTITNWNPQVDPIAPAAAADFGNIITVSRIVTVDGTFSVGTLGFDNANVYSLTGGTLNINGPINVSNINGNGAHTKASDLSLVTNSTISQNSTGTFILSGTISNTGGAILNAGTRSLLLTGTNTYTGDTTISAGSLEVRQDASFGDADGTVILNGGRLLTDTTFESTRPHNFNAAGGSFTIRSFTTFTLSGVASGSADVAINPGSSSTVVLSGINTYTGATSIIGGGSGNRVLRLSGVGTLGNGSALSIGNLAKLQIEAGAGIKTIGSLSGGGGGIEPVSKKYGKSTFFRLKSRRGFFF